MHTEATVSADITFRDSNNEAVSVRAHYDVGDPFAVVLHFLAANKEWHIAREHLHPGMNPGRDGDVWVDWSQDKICLNLHPKGQLFQYYAPADSLRDFIWTVFEMVPPLGERERAIVDQGLEALFFDVFPDRDESSRGAA